MRRAARWMLLRRLSSCSTGCLPTAQRQATRALRLPEPAAVSHHRLRTTAAFALTEKQGTLPRAVRRRASLVLGAVQSLQHRAVRLQALRHSSQLPPTLVALLRR